MGQPELSVVIPLYNEAESLCELQAVLAAALEIFGDRYEIIFVDDGSTDGSFQQLQRLREMDKRVKVVRLRINQGKATALVAGFRQAQGRILLTMDADLQDDPREIMRFLQKLEEGYDLVSGWKAVRNDPWTRRALSVIFNWVTARLTGLGLHDFNCGYKAYRRNVIDELRLHGDLYRFIPVLAHWRGFKVGEIQVQHHPRRYGCSKYGMERLHRGFFDLLTVLMLTRYTTRPLHLFGLLGLMLGLIGSSAIAYLSVGWFLGEWIGARPLFLLAGLMLVAGLQLISFGLLAELVIYGADREREPPVELILS
jgi:glycosyltransferase involved in cell wall biosynthesis